MKKIKKEKDELAKLKEAENEQVFLCVIAFAFIIAFCIFVAFQLPDIFTALRAVM